jgi:selenide,water dikinase
VTFTPGIPQKLQDVFFDPQTSGGLLIAVAAGEASNLRNALIARGVPDAAIIGEVVAEPREKILVE